MNFNSKIDGDQFHLITIYDNERAIRPNVFIIIMPIESLNKTLRAAQVGGLKVDIKR